MNEVVSELTKSLGEVFCGSETATEADGILFKRLASNLGMSTSFETQNPLEFRCQLEQIWAKILESENAEVIVAQFIRGESAKLLSCLRWFVETSEGSEKSIPKDELNKFKGSEIRELLIKRIKLEAAGRSLTVMTPQKGAVGASVYGVSAQVLPFVAKEN